jgi:hypothetical protein
VRAAIQFFLGFCWPVARLTFVRVFGFFFVLCENEENIYKYFLYIFLVFLKVFLPCV